MNAVTGLIISCLALSVYGLPTPQIVGGREALDGAHPYMVSLRTDLSANYTHFCGGAIISKRYVITTAKCIVSFGNPYKVYVFVGSNYLSNATSYRAIKLIIHAGYNSKLRIHDIGLIEVSDDFEFNEKVKSIDLPTADRNFDNYPLMAIGWGGIWFGGQIFDHLKEVIVKGYYHELCSRFEFTKDSHICTFTEEYEGICHGDEGGPLVADNVLVGLISFSYAPCGRGAPDVSTRVFSYRSWITYYTGI